MVERTFRDIPEGKLSEADQQSFLVSLGWSRGASWEDLLRSKRVLMISEAGAGKTYECRGQARRLWDAGEPAFFLELEGLSSGDLARLLDPEEEARLAAWLCSQSDIATFFLDSIDELRLSPGSLEQALKCLKRAIGDKLRQARIVLTTRPIPFDVQLVRSLLPTPPAPSTEPRDEAFAKIAMGDPAIQKVRDGDCRGVPDWRTVALMPLSDSEILEFARVQGVANPTELMEDLEKRNAQEFARRPQDLIELCADWREHRRIRTHRDQVATNVRVKLLPRENRPEPAELSGDRAIEGASRLALAMMVTGRMTIRHSAESDVMADEAALDPATILADWNPSERKALLERPLFGFASYGRVRFHHRSVVEFLAAERLRVLRKGRMSFLALKRLIFAQTKNKTIVRPSKRPIAGWLALGESRVFELLRDNEPAVLLDEGDPESLSGSQRKQALGAYVARYGQGGWRGLRIPTIQVHRFSSSELADDVIQLWEMGIENPEVRLTLLHLIEAGRMGDCADLAHGVAVDAQASAVERVTAVDGMVTIRDPRLEEIASGVVAGEELWPEEIARGLLPRLFPGDLSIEQLCQSLSWMKEEKSSIGDLSWLLPRVIADAGLEPTALEELRDGLANLLSAGLRWQREWPHIVCDRPHLSGALAETCVRGLDIQGSREWLHASVLALRVHGPQYSNDEPRKALQERLRNASADENAGLFWADDALLQSLHPIADAWERWAWVTLHDGPVEIDPERDLEWIKEGLGDRGGRQDERALLLEGAMRLSPSQEEWRDHVSALRPLVADEPSLCAAIDERLNRSKSTWEESPWAKEAAQRKANREQQEAEDKASWIRFWREVDERPERAFSSERGMTTAWKLWQAMSHDVRVSGWNRRFIEEQFGRETADRLRHTLMGIWRREHPTLPSERPEEERGSYPMRWHLGLAAIYAEAEDPSWAAKLDEEEASRAARFAPIQLNGLPSWMESLVAAHPEAVDEVLGKELSWELGRELDGDGHSMLLQDISHATESVGKVFLERLLKWLVGEGDTVDDADNLAGAAKRLRQVVGTLLKHGGEDVRLHLLDVARQRLREDLPEERTLVWLATLMRVDPELGVSELEDRIGSVEPEARSEAVQWFSVLFGDRHEEIDVKAWTVNPELLLRLLRLAYLHVRPVDDAEHEGAYTPDARDLAEDARGEIGNALLEARGEEGWAAKLEMAKDPLFAQARDRVVAVAEEHWAREVDSDTFNDTQAVALDKAGEAPPSTNQAMFALMSDRLAELDELLLGDMSPREAWAEMTKERLLRREVARALSDAANGLYKVDQEAVTADENETDIRLRSVVSEHEAVIELKRADDRSARDLRDTIDDQLVTKYLAAENSRSGCLLVSVATEKRWTHPDKGTPIGLAELVALLRNEAKRVEDKVGGAVAVRVQLLDLRPRLRTGLR